MSVRDRLERLERKVQKKDPLPWIKEGASMWENVYRAEEMFPDEGVTFGGEKEYLKWISENES